MGMLLLWDKTPMEKRAFFSFWERTHHSEKHVARAEPDRAKENKF